jgi:hypothetical protein
MQGLPFGARIFKHQGAGIFKQSKVESLKPEIVILYTAEGECRDK